MKIVIVGYGPGGAAAAIAARAFDRNAEIEILTREQIDSHRKPGAAMALEFPDTDELTIADWSVKALAEKRITVKPGTNVLSGNLSNRTLSIQDAKGKESNISFDKLILATGGTPSVPEMPGTDLKGVYTIQDMADATRVGLEIDKIRSVVVIGAGFSGLETAHRLYKLGKEVHIIIRSRIMRRLLEEPMSKEVLDRLPNKVHVHLGSAPEAILGEDKVRAVKVAGEEIPADVVLFMTGVKPKAKLGEALGLKIGPLGGIVVNEHMETSVSGVYAVGDCVEMIDPIAKKPILMPVGSTAARAGRQAGVAAVGGKKVYDDTAFRLQYDHIFNTDIVCVGHSTNTAQGFGIQTKVEYFEDPFEFTKIALVTDMNDRLIGGHVSSPPDVLWEWRS